MIKNQGKKPCPRCLERNQKTWGHNHSAFQYTTQIPLTDELCSKCYAEDFKVDMMPINMEVDDYLDANYKEK